ncbi:MAG TPA: hypothetical protein VKQ07_09680 [Jatrophihabitantaceae bacterium]|nr:hypothetical protein [Jatrophihabitantaceae bacterium]
MSSGSVEHGATGPDSNGLIAPTYVPLTDVDDAVGHLLLVTLGRARIAAYLTAVPGAEDDHMRRLFVAADERSDARTIVASVLGANGGDAPAAPARRNDDDALAGMDTDAEFAALVADWHVDTIAAVRDAERQLREEDAEWRARLAQPPVEDPVWLDDDHYIPPPPPPLPRLAAPTISAMALIAISILILGLGGRFGLATDLTFLLGICGLLLAGYILFTRLRSTRDDSDDDGAVI